MVNFHCSFKKFSERMSRTLAEFLPLYSYPFVLWQSVEQIGNRADRLNIETENLFLYSSTDVEVHDMYIFLLDFLLLLRTYGLGL